MVEAGTGAAITVDLGNKVPLPGFAPNAPWAETARSRSSATAPMWSAGRSIPGRPATWAAPRCWRSGGATVLVTERPHEPWDLGVFRCAGYRPYCGAVPDPEVADVLPPGLCTALARGRGMCECGHHQLEPRPVPFRETGAADLSAGPRHATGLGADTHNSAGRSTGNQEKETEHEFQRPCREQGRKSGKTSAAVKQIYRRRSARVAT